MIFAATFRFQCMPLASAAAVYCAILCIAASAAGPAAALATRLAPGGVGPVAADLPVILAKSQGIAVLVNDEPITNYEISLRQRYLGLGDPSINDRARDKFKSLISAKSTTERLRDILREVIKANPGKSKEEILAIFEKRKQAFAKSLQEQAVSSARKTVAPGLRKKALDELVEERLKIQEAKRLNVIVDDEEVDRILTGMAQRNKMDLKQFGAHMKKMGTDVLTLKSRFRAMLSWRNVIRRQFGHQIAITTRDIDRAVATTEADDKTELNVQRITLLFAQNLGQKELARRLQEASVLRTQYTGCSMTGSLAKTAGGARFDNLGPTEASRIPEPTRTMLVNARDGEMLPPTVGDKGVELWVLCGRSTVEADTTKRETAQEELRQREFQALAERHLSDLRQDAHIEYR